METIYLVRRNNYLTMLDKNTWEKTAYYINRSADYRAFCLFFKWRKMKAPASQAKSTILIDLYNIRFVYYFEWILRLAYFLKNNLKNNDVVVVDLFSFPVLLLIKGFITRNSVQVVFDMRTLYFNYDGDKVESIKDRFFRRLTDYSVKYSIANNYKISIIVRHIWDNYLSDFEGVERLRIFEWSSGFDAEDFQFEANAKSPIKFIYHGHITRNRNIEGAILIMKRLREYRDDFILEIYGKGPHLNNLLTFLKESDVADYVLYRGSREYSEMPTILKSADIGLITYPDIEYWKYNNPIKFSEYLSSGVLICTTPISTFRDFLKDFDYVELPFEVEESTIRMLNDVCSRLLDGSYRTHLLKNAEKVVLRHRWEDKASDIMNALRK